MHLGRRISGVQRGERGFIVDCAGGDSYDARVVVLATGGSSLPKTGSDGAGYSFARAFGHGYIDTTPALVPLVLSDSVHTTLAGIAHPVTVTVRVEGTEPVRLDGAMLWTHFGVSGPVMLNASRHWLRARLDDRAVQMSLNMLPGATFEALEAWLQEEQRLRPRAFVRTVIASRLPAAVADAWVAAAGLDASETLAHLGREARRRLVAALLETPISVRDSRGYNYAEVTA